MSLKLKHNAARKFTQIYHSFFMKQFFKVNQFIGEKFGLLENTKDDVRLVELQNKFLIISKLFDKLYERIEEFIYPNIATRQKMKFNDKIGMIKPTKEMKYPQIEEGLSTIFFQNIEQIGGMFGNVCRDMAAQFNGLSRHRVNLELQIKNEVLAKLSEIKKTEISAINKFIKKVDSSRLEYDSIRRKKDMDQQIQTTLLKYNKCKSVCIEALVDFVENSQKYYIEIMYSFSKVLNQFYTDSMQSSKQYSDLMKLKLDSLPDIPRILRSQSNASNSSARDSFDSEEISINMPKIENSEIIEEEIVLKTQQATAIFDFDGRDNDELTVIAGEKVEIIQKVDEEWYLAKFNGTVGIIPIAFVKINEN